jgi:hypothetical protein
MDQAFGRNNALRAIAAATGRAPTAGIRDHPDGLVSLDDGTLPALYLMPISGLRSPNTWQFDEARHDRRDTVPVWRGYLVYREPDGEAALVGLGDRDSLMDHWQQLAQRLTADELAVLIGRYFGRDLGLPVHHTVLAALDEFRYIATPGSLAAVESMLAFPEIESLPGDRRRLSFLTSFLEGDQGQAGPTATRLGLAAWTAEWGPDEPVLWYARVLVRDLPSIYSPLPPQAVSRTPST